MQIRLILLDFDGTLADTRRANTLAYVATLREAGYALTEEEYAAKYFGMRCNEFLTRYGIADPAERERLRLRKIALYPAFFDTVRLNRPLWEFCRQFRAQGGRVWIVSTGSRAKHRQRHAPPGDHGRGTAGGEHGCGNLGCGGQRLDRCG
ncbi:MAG: HAD hydrolase-like protein [Alistipes sp.]